MNHDLPPDIDEADWRQQLEQEERLRSILDHCKLHYDLGSTYLPKDKALARTLALADELGVSKEFRQELNLT